MTTLTPDDPHHLLLQLRLLVDSPECVVFAALRSDAAYMARVDLLRDDALVLVDGEQSATVAWSGLPFERPVMCVDDNRHELLVVLVPDAVWEAGPVVWRASNDAAPDQ